MCVCVLVLGLPTAQEVSEHPVLSGAGVEGQVHGEYHRAHRHRRAPGERLTSITSPTSVTMTTSRTLLSVLTSLPRPVFQPFSNGLVTVMVPQLRRENSLLLWSTLDLNSPVHAFVGHDDVVLEFQWRPQKEGDGGE